VQVFAFSFVWAIGGAVYVASQRVFQVFVGEKLDFAGYPGCYDFVVDMQTKDWKSWETKVCMPFCFCCARSGVYASVVVVLGLLLLVW
jgi:hypothetical protein